MASWALALICEAVRKQGSWSASPLSELRANVRPLAFTEGQCENHLVEHFGIFCKTAADDIIHYVTQCPLYKGPHDKFWSGFSSRRHFISADKLVSMLPVVRK